MLSSRSLALRRQLPSLVRHQSTKITRWRQFSEDIRDAERRGTLRAPPSGHPLPSLWRCKELGLFYQRGIVETWKKYQAAPANGSQEHYLDNKFRVYATVNLVKVISSPLLPFAAFLPSSIFPVSCILPATMERYVREASRMPPAADIIAAQDMLRKIGGLDFLAIGDDDDQTEFWKEHSHTILKLWHIFPIPPPVLRLPAILHAHLEFVVAEDELLRKRDVASLETWELERALDDRGMHFPHLSEKEKRTLLHWWIHESGNSSDKLEKMLDTSLAVHVFYISQSSQSV